MSTAERVRLRPVEASDLPWMCEMQRDPESCRMAVVNPRTRDAFFEHWEKVLPNAKITPRVILFDDALVGLISCFQPDAPRCPDPGQTQEPGLDHIGYWIDRAFWGRGIASRALELLLQEVPQRPLLATASTGNVASLRILQKCGFVIERIHDAPASERYPACEQAELRLV